jgi:hypothetical protein
LESADAYRRPNTSKPGPGHKIYPYLLRCVAVERPNQVWAMNITYIPMSRGFVYLAAVVDWFDPPGSALAALDHDGGRVLPASRRSRRRWPSTASPRSSRNRVGYIFGLAGNKVLLRRVTAQAEQVALDRLDVSAHSKVRRYAEFRYGAQTWKTQRRVIARIEASGQGVDSRFIVTNLAGLPKSLYEKVYCAGTGRKPDQGPQATLGFRPYFLHQGDRQPVPAAASYRRLLADAPCAG